jgi:site-specific DNA-cytosine methylase
MLAGSSPCEGYQVAEMRRGIDGCRERLRRNRAARRIAERATPHTFETSEELPELALTAAGTEVPGEET